MSIYVRIKKALGDFTLDAEFEAENEIMALLGASGCGKSMTLKCIAGVAKPDEGVIVVNGVTLFDSKRRINLSPQKRRVGLLFQNYALFPNMTVERNIMAALSPRCGKTEARERFHALAEKFYINGLENHYPANLSGGQQQRVALARIMASAPSIIMLDEPLSALDSYLRWQLEEELARILDDFSGTTLYVSHSRDEVYRICDRVCVIDDGKFERPRSITELFESPDSLASALLSGCKNYSRVERKDERLVHAIDWNVYLACDRPVGSDISHIGVRAHYVGISHEACDGENVFPCSVIRVTDDIFSTIINVRPTDSNSAEDFSRIRVELPKDETTEIREGDVLRVKINPRDIMLLTCSNPRN
ncbi:MAG: ATP-binding cassette domain-containing protein [Synergistaceae bacterium]|jgi:molybdate transport system ATP-binding protein|nr:ATP-binding cassette domain-containing protein [Synergistaceae bacterium]